MFTANRSVSGRLSSDIAIDDISIDSQPLTTIIVTPTRPPVVSTNFRNTTFDTKSNTEGWHTDYANFEWIQTGGELSSTFGYYGPGSDYTSISIFNNT